MQEPVRDVVAHHHSRAVFLISPPIEDRKRATRPCRGAVQRGSSATSPIRLFYPFDCFLLALLVGGHGPGAGLEIILDDVGPRRLGQEMADPAPADHPVEALVHLLVDRDCKLFSTAAFPLHV
jgi:hypothetical protein